MFKKRQPRNLEPSHMYLTLEDGTLVDLGPASVEELGHAVLAAQMAHTYLRNQRNKKLSAAILSRNKHFLERIYNNAKTHQQDQ